MKILEVESLSKDYRQHFWLPKRRVLHSVSFDVMQGEIFGFLGPNGSGKSTTIKILLEIIFPSGGSAKLFGRPVGEKAVKKRLGFLPENPYFHEFLSADHFLRFHGLLSGMDAFLLEKRIPEVLELVGMKGTNKILLRNFSKGMLQRIGLAQAIIHDPELVILDEPMTGLDPLGRKEVRDLMMELKRQGKTVFFSTHILADVEAICDRVAILNKGRLLSCGSLRDLISVDTKYVDMTWTGCSDEAAQYFKTLDSQLTQQADQVYLKLYPQAGEATSAFELRVQTVISKATAMKASLHYLSPKKDTLEDVFLKQVGRLESRV